MSIKFKDKNKYAVGEYINSIAKLIIDDEETTKAIFYEKPNFKEFPTVPNPDQLIYKNIFDYPFIIDFVKNKGTFVTMDVNTARIDNTYERVFVYVNVAVSQNLWKTEYGINRVNYLCANLKSLISNQRFAIGKVLFLKDNNYVLNNNIVGKTLVFEVVDFV